jgi:hypothetical protein
MRESVDLWYSPSYDLAHGHSIYLKNWPPSKNEADWHKIKATHTGERPDLDDAKYAGTGFYMYSHKIPSLRKKSA